MVRFLVGISFVVGLPVMLGDVYAAKLPELWGVVLVLFLIHNCLWLWGFVM